MLERGRYPIPSAFSAWRDFGICVVPQELRASLEGRPDAMKVIGLTGGIACGKSTVTAALREDGMRVIDLDAMVAEIQRPRSAWPACVS